MPSRDPLGIDPLEVNAGGNEAKPSTQLVRSQFRSALISWRTMFLIVLAVTFVSWYADYAFVDPDNLQYLFTLLVAIYGVLAWLGAGIMIAVTTPWRRAQPAVERTVNAIVMLITGGAVAFWLWALPQLIASQN